MNSNRIQTNLPLVYSRSVWLLSRSHIDLPCSKPNRPYTSSRKETFSNVLHRKFLSIIAAGMRFVLCIVNHDVVFREDAGHECQPRISTEPRQKRISSLKARSPIMNTSTAWDYKQRLLSSPQSLEIILREFHASTWLHVPTTVSFL